jgi:hypothetical protein
MKVNAGSFRYRIQIVKFVLYRKGVKMKRLFTSLFLLLALLAMTAGTVFAQETTPITGTIQTVTLETDATTNEITVIVTVLDEPQTHHRL